MLNIRRRKKRPAKETVTKKAQGSAPRPAPRSASAAKKPTAPSLGSGRQKTAAKGKGQRTGPSPSRPVGREKGRREEPEARPSQPVLEEVYESPVTRKVTGLFTFLLAAAAFVGLLAVVFVMLLIFTGGFGGTSAAPPPPEPASDKELVSSLAENFSSAYLELNAGEGDSRVEERLRPFLAPEAAAAVPPKTSGEVTRAVKNTSAYDARALRDGRWVVYTRSSVEVTQPGAEDSDEEDPSSSSNGSADDAAEDVSVKNVGLEVFVGVKDGEAAVDAAPNVIKPPSAFEGAYGAIYAEGAVPVDDEDLVSLLEGYFDALYGSAESQANLDRFFDDEAAGPKTARPVLPDDSLSYVRLGEGWAYPVTGGEAGAAGEAGEAGGFAESYDVEMTVHVADDSLGFTAIQTHLLRVQRDGTSWVIVGTTPTVGTGSAPTPAPAGGQPKGEERGGER